MPPPTDTLWDSEPRTLIKHQIYRHYLQCWMGKICRTFESASIVDAFAGPGQYRDGPDGSPVVIAKAFLEHSARADFNHLHLICREKRADRRNHLQELVNQLPATPKLRVTVLPSGQGDSFEELAAVARPAKPALPVLWIIDPFNPSGAPFELVRASLNRPRDEVLVTWFADEIYRFCEDSTKINSMDRHFGGSQWTKALESRGESARKLALLDAYQQRLRDLPNVFTNTFSISGKNETARYSIVYATHSEAGLQCFNPVRWKLDPVQGAAANERRGMHQGDLFAEAPVITKLRVHLNSLAGQAVSFTDLSRVATNLGHLPKHLRQALDEMAEEGRAVREMPLSATTRWPENSVIRFYPNPPAVLAVTADGPLEPT
jgi:three-Cys-motif partner protein